MTVAEIRELNNLAAETEIAELEVYRGDNCVRMRCAFFFSSRRRHTRYWRDWSSDVCSSDLGRRLLDRLEVGVLVPVLDEAVRFIVRDVRGPPRAEPGKDAHMGERKAPLSRRHPGPFGVFKASA